MRTGRQLGLRRQAGEGRNEHLHPRAGGRRGPRPRRSGDGDGEDHPPIAEPAAHRAAAPHGDPGAVRGHAPRVHRHEPAARRCRARAERRPRDAGGGPRPDDQAAPELSVLGALRRLAAGRVAAPLRDVAHERRVGDLDPRPAAAGHLRAGRLRLRHLAGARRASCGARRAAAERPVRPHPPGLQHDRALDRSLRARAAARDRLRRATRLVPGDRLRLGGSERRRQHRDRSRCRRSRSASGSPASTRACCAPTSSSRCRARTTS